MIASISQPKTLFPLAVSEGLIAEDAKQLAQIIVNDTDRLLADAKSKKQLEDEDDFLISTDALNLARVIWRCREELNVLSVDGVESEITEHICDIRKYRPDEFDLVKIATKNRARMPFGWQPLEYALLLAMRQPVKLLLPALRDRPWPALIVAMAIQLQSLQKDKPILLPIEALRDLLRLRKSVVAGVIKQLIEEKVIEETGEKYHTNRAREFKFIAEHGVAWEYLPAETPRNA